MTRRFNDRVPAVARARACEADRLFAQLDDRNLMVLGQAWHLEVYGICEEAGRRWVQLAIDGPQHYTLTVVLTATATVARTVRALSSWLADPAHTQSLQVV